MFKRLLYLGLGSATAAGVAWSNVSPRSKNAEAYNGTGARSPFTVKNWTAFELKQIENVNHNCKIFHFSLKDPQDTSILPVASCITTRFIDEHGKEIIRPYTPINQNSVGEFQLLVKNYSEGTMSKHIHHLKVGDTLEAKGPWEKLHYTTNMKKFIGMIAGGTGITPMLQMLQKIFGDEEDKTIVNLLFANLSEKDIILKGDLDLLHEKYPDRFHVYYIVDEPGPNWTGFSGRMTEDVLRKTMPPPGDDSLICVCGPPPMMKSISGERKSVKDPGPLSGKLKDIGYKDNMVFKF